PFQMCEDRGSPVGPFLPRVRVKHHLCVCLHAFQSHNPRPHRRPAREPPDGFPSWRAQLIVGQVCPCSDSTKSELAPITEYIGLAPLALSESRCPGRHDN
ncbi:hypothetical protein KUCAC02_020913, partial [Chaenocephalus aceratus]